MPDSSSTYELGTLDYVVVFATIAASTAVGMYHAWKSKMYTTTREFLIASGNVGLIPLIISALVTVTHPVFLLGQTTEVYNNGFQMSLMVITIMGATIFAMHTITPVYYQLNIATHNEYLEYRFNRLIRILNALLHTAQSTVGSGSLVYLTSIILSDATGISYWWSVTLICGICAAYSAMGGFRAVIWTDVLQAVVIFISVGLLIIKGTQHVGGFSEIWNRNYEGNRTVMLRFPSDNSTNYSIWSVLAGGASFGFAGSVMSQSFLQRQMSNKTLQKAKWTLFFGMALFAVFQILSFWIGMIFYARYHDCDPLLNKQIQSRDMISALFAKEVFHGIDGLLGLYIAGILATALSTISSIANGFAAVLIIDIVKPAFPKLKETTTTQISKLIGISYGVAVAATTLVIAYVGSVMQVIYIILGVTSGSTCGILLLGLFFPWATSSGVGAGYICGMAACWWAAFGHIANRKLLPKYMLPVSNAGCEADTLDRLNRTMNYVGQNLTSPFNHTTVLETSQILAEARNLTQAESHGSDDVLALYRMTPIWYFTLTISVTMIIGIVVSIATGIQDLETLNPRLISPVTWSILGRLSVRNRIRLGFKSEKYHGDIRKLMDTTAEINGQTVESDIAELSQILEDEEKNNNEKLNEN